MEPILQPDFSKISDKQIAFFEAIARHIAYGGARGGGKAQPLDEPVLTPFGFRPMGSLKVGSIVSNPDGSVSRVIQIHPQGIKPIYKVTFIDGASTRVTAEHLWSASKTCADTGDKVYDTQTLRELLAKNTYQNVLVPLCEPVTFTRPTRTVATIKPYTLGVLLGDGCLVGRNCTSLTTMDAEIVNGVLADGYTATKGVQKGRAHAYYLTKFKAERDWLTKEKLCVKSERKYIPDVYKYAPISDRMALLRGLMDADGYADGRGHCSYTSVSKRLAEDVQWLIRSIGGKATITSKQGEYAKDGKRFKCLEAYTVYIQTPNNRSLFTIPRKVERCSAFFNGGVSELKRRMVSIEPCGEAECQCITVDNPNGLYVTKDFIVTHNSWAMRWKFVLLAMKYPNLRILLLRRTLPELTENHIKPLLKDLAPAINAGHITYNVSEHEFRFWNGSTIKASYCESEKDVYRYQGHEYDVIGLEEATHFTEEQMSFLTTCNRNTRTDFSPRMYYTCNPGGVGHNWVKRLFIDREYREQERSEDYAFIPAKVYDNKALMENDPEYVRSLENLSEDRRRAYLEGDWDALMGQFFREWRRDKHVIEPFEEIPSSWRRFRSMDWGYNDPCCVLWFAVSPDSRVYVYDEIYQNQTLANDMAPLIKQKTGFDKVSYTVASPDMWAKRGGVLKANGGLTGESIAEVFMKCGIPLRPADNSRIVGWQRVREYLREAPDGKPYLQVFSNCTNLIKYMPLLQFDEHDREDAMDGNDHACLAGDTIIKTTRGDVRIKDLVGKTGEVFCYDGTPTVSKFFDVRMTQRDAEIYEVELEDGTTFRGTGNHPVLTKNGWKRLDELTDADFIVTI